MPVCFRADDAYSILVVDDDPIVRRFVSTTLQRNGFAVLEAASGKDGLERFAEHRDALALILTDIMMPGMSGPEMIERIRAIHPGTVRHVHDRRHLGRRAFARAKCNAISCYSSRSHPSIC